MGQVTMEEQTDAHTRLQRRCPAGKCYWSQKLPAGRRPAGASQQRWARRPLPTDCPWHCYQEQPPPLGSPGKALAWHSLVPGFAPRSAPCPAPTGIFSDHPTTLPWGWSHASSTQLRSNTRRAGSLPPNYNSVSMESGSIACSPRGEVSF